jgi:osmotically-inducible protein OsmY
MNRRLSYIPVVALLLVFAVACGSINRQTPKQWDNDAMKADVKGKIAEVSPSKTFDIGVTVDRGVVTLSGTVDTADEARRMGDAAKSVNGVTRVINNIQVKR